MKIKFLGTAAAEGFPALFCDCEMCEYSRAQRGKDLRTRSQAVINDDLLIDFPADTYMHVLNHGLALHKISNILITHSHSDHFYIDDIAMRLPGFSNLKEPKPLNIYGDSKVCELLNSHKNTLKLKNKGFLNIVYAEPFIPINVGEYTVIPLIADHNKAEDCLIYIILKNGKSLLYAHDTGYFPKETMEYLKNTKAHLDFATFDCCYSLNHCERGHMGFDEVLTMKKRLSDIGVIDKNTICCINHFSHNGSLPHKKLSEYAEKYEFITAFDGMEVEF